MTGLTSAGLASTIASGLETPDVALNLRKSGDSMAGTESAQNPQLYTVLEQRKAAVGQGLMGTDHVYVIPGGAAEAAGGPKVGDKRRCVLHEHGQAGGRGAQEEQTLCARGTRWRRACDGSCILHACTAPIIPQPPGPPSPPPPTIPSHPPHPRPPPRPQGRRRGRRRRRR